MKKIIKTIQLLGDQIGSELKCFSFQLVVLDFLQTASLMKT